MSDHVFRSADPARPLPARANLEHLKNEAKQHLQALRRQQPDAKLAAAQLAVARRYGFPSWRQLKAYVDALNDEGERVVNAVRNGDLDTIRIVLDRYPELVNATTDLEERIRPSDTLAMRLIHLAVAENQNAVTTLLVERGAALNLRNVDGRLPIHDCFELGHDECAQILIEAGAEIDVCAAAAYGQNDRLREILQREPAQANDLTTNLPPLGWSAYGDQPGSARILIAHGAILNRAPYDVAIWGAVTHVANLKVA